eukprot:TRINITY_DN2542_c0_g1_i1.p1 TRINITY_DN2542_c0_g1~~TRINITY_DN2542_c0_g1_i1.p1  ORF type:complete len:853 (+),score=252.84 TRINITY_DN2542_c0_g1_i1:163-2721(+)
MRRSKGAPAPPVQKKGKLGAVFGRPLTDVMKDGRIPAVIEETISFLETKGVKTEGIFRVSGSVSEIDKIKREYDAGKTGLEATFGSPHNAAGVLKLYLRSMPSCLFLGDNYEALKDTDGDTDEMREIIDELPKANRKVIKRVMDFLVEVSEYSGTNKMSSKALGTCLGTNLINPGGMDDSDEADVMIDVASTSGKLLAAMIDNCEELFDYEVSDDGPKRKNGDDDDDDDDNDGSDNDRFRSNSSSSFGRKPVSTLGGGSRGASGTSGRKLYHGSDDSAEIEEIPTGGGARGGARRDSDDEDAEGDGDDRRPLPASRVALSSSTNKARNGTAGPSVAGNKKQPLKSSSGKAPLRNDNDDPYAPSDEEGEDEDAANSGHQRRSQTADDDDEDEDVEVSKPARSRAASSTSAKDAKEKDKQPAKDKQDKKKPKTEKAEKAEKPEKSSPSFFSTKGFKSMFKRSDTAKQETPKGKPKKQALGSGSDEEDNDADEQSRTDDKPQSGKKLSPTQKSRFKSLVSKTVSGFFDRSSTPDELSRSVSAKAGKANDSDEEDGGKQTKSSKRSSSVPPQRPASRSGRNGDEGSESDDGDGNGDRKRLVKSQQMAVPANKKPSTPAASKNAGAKSSSAQPASKTNLRASASVALPESDNEADGDDPDYSKPSANPADISYEDYLASRLERVTALTAKQRAQDPTLQEELAAFEEFISKFSELLGKSPAPAKTARAPSPKPASRSKEADEPKPREPDRTAERSSAPRKSRPTTPTADSDDEPKSARSRRKKETRESVQEKYDAAIAEKRELKGKLKNFESKFLKRNGRKVASKEDRSPMLPDYSRYKELKAEVTELEAQLAQMDE